MARFQARNLCISRRRQEAADVSQIYLIVSTWTECDDRWDKRGSGSGPTKPTADIVAHDAEVNSVAFSPWDENILLTGSSDKVRLDELLRGPRLEFFGVQSINLWDLRKTSQKLHSFIHHEDEVLQLAFSPHSATVFASGSSDRRINLWNMASIGLEQTPDDAEDGPPELMFMHGGHTDIITDLSWNMNAKWTLASSAEDNVMQVWNPSRNITAAENVVIP